MFTFLEIKSNYPKLTQKQEAQQIGYSDSASEGYRDQINNPSPFKRKTTKRKKMNSQDGSTTIKGEKCETEIENISGKKLIDKTFKKN